MNGSLITFRQEKIQHRPETKANQEIMMSVHIDYTVPTVFLQNEPKTRSWIILDEIKKSRKIKNNNKTKFKK